MGENSFVNRYISIIKFLSVYGSCTISIQLFVLIQKNHCINCGTDVKHVISSVEYACKFF